jgi:hypothetical protein
MKTDSSNPYSMVSRLELLHILNIDNINVAKIAEIKTTKPRCPSRFDNRIRHCIAGN